MIGNRESRIGNRREQLPSRSGTHIWVAALLLTLSSVAGAQARSAADFWTTLGDPTLVRLVGDALRDNQDVEAMRARVNNARAVRTTALLDLAPAITAVGGYSRQRVASSVIPGNASGVSLPEQDVWD